MIDRVDCRAARCLAMYLIECRFRKVERYIREPRYPDLLHIREREREMILSENI